MRFSQRRAHHGDHRAGERTVYADMRKCRCARPVGSACASTAGESILAQRVSGVRNFGSYSCRNIYGAEHGRRSEHATADAVDIGAFTLDDGRVIAIAKAWPRNGIEARFLRDVHDGACRFFNAVLGPNYNHAHYDHFHLDRGRFRVCR